MELSRLFIVYCIVVNNFLTYPSVDKRALTLFNILAIFVQP